VTIKERWVKKYAFVFASNLAAQSRALVSLISREESGIHWLHARGASEAAHKPIVNAFGVVDVHAGEKANRISDAEFDHANDAFSVLLAAVIGASGQVLNQANSLRNLDLLLFSQLIGLSAHIRRRIKEHLVGVVVLRIASAQLKANL